MASEPAREPAAKGPLESVVSDTDKLTSFLQQNQGFPAEMVCASQREMALGSLLYERKSVGPHCCVCRTTWKNSESGEGGGGPWSSLDIDLIVTMKMAGKRSRMKTANASKRTLGL